MSATGSLANASSPSKKSASPPRQLPMPQQQVPAPAPIIPPPQSQPIAQQTVFIAAAPVPTPAVIVQQQAALTQPRPTAVAVTTHTPVVIQFAQPPQLPQRSSMLPSPPQVPSLVRQMSVDKGRVAMDTLGDDESGFLCLSRGALKTGSQDAFFRFDFFAGAGGFAA